MASLTPLLDVRTEQQRQWKEVLPSRWALEYPPVGKAIAQAQEDAQALGPKGTSRMPRKGGRPQGTPRRLSTHMENALTPLLCKTLR